LARLAPRLLPPRQPRPWRRIRSNKDAEASGAPSKRRCHENRQVDSEWDRRGPGRRAGQHRDGRGRWCCPGRSDGRGHEPAAWPQVARGWPQLPSRSGGTRPSVRLPKPRHDPRKSDVVFGVALEHTTIPSTSAAATAIRATALARLNHERLSVPKTLVFGTPDAGSRNSPETRFFAALCVPQPVPESRSHFFRLVLISGIPTP
jgi:hypothetical protein